MRFKICGKYQRIHKRVAQRLYNNGHTIVVCAGNELNSSNSIKISVLDEVFESVGGFDTIVSEFKDFQRITENNKKYIELERKLNKNDKQKRKKFKK